MAVTWSVGTQTATISGDNGGTNIVTSQTDISMSATDNSFNDASSGFSGLSEGDRILVKGCSNFENNGQFIVKSSTSSKIIVYENLITESAGQSITIRERGAGYSFLDIVDAINNTTYAKVYLYPGETSTTYPDILYNANSAGGSRIIWFGCRFIIDDDALLKDYSTIVLHTWNNSTDVITFNNAYSTIELGYLNNKDQDKPITAYSTNTLSDTRTGCMYSFMSSNSSASLFGFNSGRVGILNVYGGMWKLRDDTVSGKVEANGENETYTTFFPDRTNLIQLNIANHGGLDFTNAGGTRIQECQFKSSRNTGVNIAGGTFLNMKKIQLVRSDIGLDFNDTDDCDIFGVQFRGCTDEVRVRDINANQTVKLVDSDTITDLHTTMTFATGASLIEGTSYNLTAYDSDGNGTNINGARASIYRVSNGSQYGDEVTSSGGGVGTPTTFGQLIGYRYGYDSTHTTVAGRIVYGNAGVRIRLYGKKFIDISKVLGENGIYETLILEDNPLISIAKATVAAYTGISVNTSTEEITLTSNYTISQLYHYLQYLQAESGNLETAEILKSSDGIAFTLLSSWDILGLSYLNLSGAYIVNRYIPVDFKNIVNGTRSAVINYTNNSVLGTSTSSGITDSIAVEYTASTTVYGRSRLAGYKPYSTVFTLSTSGNTVYASLEQDSNFT